MLKFNQMEVEAYLLSQPAERQNIMLDIHQIILKNDDTVTAAIEPMMGKEMILYKANGSMKYGLASVKNHMSLHLLPIYGFPELHAKYQALLPTASFQKGCINFTHQEQMPLKVIKELISDCAPIDLMKIREEYLKSKKQKK